MTLRHRIAGLDLSLTGTGIAMYDPAAIRPSPVVTKTVAVGKHIGHMRLHEILVAIADLRDCELVVIEDVWLGIKGSTALRLAELHGLVKHWLWLRCIPYVLVQPAQLKLYAVGKGGGKDAGKDQVLLAVERRYGGLATVTDNNQADALVLLAMALEHYGAPLAPVPVTHLAALAKVDGWPSLEHQEAVRA